MNNQIVSIDNVELYGLRGGCNTSFAYDLGRVIRFAGFVLAGRGDVGIADWMTTSAGLDAKC